MSILTSKSKEKTSTLTIRIPAILAFEIDKLRKEADAAGFTFDVSSVAVKALSAAVNTGRTELRESIKSSAFSSTAPLLKSDQ